MYTKVVLKDNCGWNGVGIQSRILIGVTPGIPTSLHATVWHGSLAGESDLIFTFKVCLPVLPAREKSFTPATLYCRVILSS